MMPSDLNDDFSHYVEHPHYGRGPRYTDLQVNPRADGICLHWNTGSMFPLSEVVLAMLPKSVVSMLSSEPHMIDGTGVVADITRQVPRWNGPVTHYFDVRTQCRDCQCRFLFFAEEQKKYYEVLKLPLDVQAVRCFPCRKKYQHVKRLQKRYGTLRTKFPDCSPIELLGLAQVMLELIELGAFEHEKLNDVRRFLKLIPEELDQREAVDAARVRVETLERHPH